jgi:hypothetical protein
MPISTDKQRNYQTLISAWKWLNKEDTREVMKRAVRAENKYDMHIGDEALDLIAKYILGDMAAFNKFAAAEAVRLQGLAREEADAFLGASSAEIRDLSPR